MASAMGLILGALAPTIIAFLCCPLFLFDMAFFSSSELCDYTSGAGIGPKNILITFSLPITRTNSCTVQYMAMRTNRRI